MLLALIATVGHVSLPTAMNLVGCASMVLTVAGLYAVVRAATGSRVAGLTAAGLVVATLVCLLLARCLSMHPVVGMVGVGLIVGVYLLNPATSGLRRYSTPAVVVVAAFGDRRLVLCAAGALAALADPLHRHRGLAVVEHAVSTRSRATSRA